MSLGLLGAAVVVVGFVAVVSSLGSGDPYYVTATAIQEETLETTGSDRANGTLVAVNGTALPDRRFPYTTEALASAGASSVDPGRSGAYYRGPIGLKEGFTHSPFDELDALRQRNPNATVAGDVFVRGENGTYRVGILREGDDP